MAALPVGRGRPAVARPRSRGCPRAPRARPAAPAGRTGVAARRRRSRSKKRRAPSRPGRRPTASTPDGAPPSARGPSAARASRHASELVLRSGSRDGVGFGEHLAGGLGPHEWLRVLVVGGDEPVDSVDQVADAVVAAASHAAAGEDREPALDEVHPGRARGGEVEVHAAVAGEPGVDLGGGGSTSCRPRDGARAACRPAAQVPPSQGLLAPAIYTWYTYSVSSSPGVLHERPP